MIGLRAYLKFLALSLLLALEFCYLVVWLSSGQANIANWMTIPVGVIWVPLVALPAAMSLTPLFWAVLFPGYFALYFLLVNRLKPTKIGVAVSSGSLALVAIMSDLIWFSQTSESLVYRTDVAMAFGLGGVSVAVVFGALTAFDLRKSTRQGGQPRPN